MFRVTFLLSLSLSLSMAVGCSDDPPSEQLLLEEQPVDPLADLQDSDLLSSIDAEMWEPICDEATAGMQDQIVDCDGVDVEVEATTSLQCQIAGESYSAAMCAATYGDWADCASWDIADWCDPSTIPQGCTALADCISVE